MNGWKWYVVAMCALGSLVNIAWIGKPRKPLTADVVITAILINASVVVAVVLS